MEKGDFVLDVAVSIILLINVIRKTINLTIKVK